MGTIINIARIFGVKKVWLPEIIRFQNTRLIRKRKIGLDFGIY